MEKACTCGVRMELRLRKVIYTNKVEIENVPIFSCDACGRSEVFAPVKSELQSTIRSLGAKPDKQLLYFNECNELAGLLLKASEKDSWKVSLEQLIEERINQLLDVLLLARSLHDEDWAEDTQKRLQAITGFAISASE